MGGVSPRGASTNFGRCICLKTDECNAQSDQMTDALTNEEDDMEDQ